MRDKPLESDWKKFRNHVPEWRERYLKRKNQEILALLTDPEKTPTEQFWDAAQRMGEEAKILEWCLDGHSRSKMTWYLSLMLRHGMIDEPDVEMFSEELREWLLSVWK